MLNGIHFTGKTYASNLISLAKFNGAVRYQFIMIFQSNFPSKSYARPLQQPTGLKRHEPACPQQEPRFGAADDAVYPPSDALRANFALNLGRTAQGLAIGRPGTPHEQAMLADEKEFLQYADQEKLQHFLNNIHLLVTRQLSYRQTQSVRALISDYSVPLAPGTETYRGMLLTQAQIRAIIAGAKGSQAAGLRKHLKIKPRPDDGRCAKYLLHGHPKKNGSYAYHGVPSTTTIPGNAGRYAEKAYIDAHGSKQDWKWSRNMGLRDLLKPRKFTPVVVTIVNDAENPAKGFVLENNYHHSKHEILLDITNDYELAENPLSAKYGMLQLKIIARNKPDWKALREKLDQLKTPEEEIRFLSQHKVNIEGISINTPVVEQELKQLVRKGKLKSPDHRRITYDPNVVHPRDETTYMFDSDHPLIQADASDMGVRTIHNKDANWDFLAENRLLPSHFSKDQTKPNLTLTKYEYNNRPNIEFYRLTGVTWEPSPSA